MHEVEDAAHERSRLLERGAVVDEMLTETLTDAQGAYWMGEVEEVAFAEVRDRRRYRRGGAL